MFRKPKVDDGAAAPAPARALTQGQRAYETRRAAEAGLTLDAWLSRKAKVAKEADKAAAARRADAAAPRKKSLITRLIDKGHRPISPGKGK